jgi:arylsulfatase A-like enzyme
MKFRLHLIVIFCGCIFTGSFLYAQQKPNIVFILSDDAGYADFSFQSKRLIATPNIDRVANEGVKFTNGYVTGAVCSPSRAGLLTGVYQAKFGHTINFTQGNKYNLPLDSLGLPLDQKLVGDYLIPQGYTTGIVGKWHLGNAAPFHPNKRGFDYFWGFLWGSSNYEVSKKRNIEENGKPLDASTIPYTTDAIGDKSVDFIKANKDKPFFLYVSFNAPHTPLQAKPELLERFTKELNNPKRALNAALTFNMDENVGKIYAALEQLNLLENTIIVFTNDNGGQVEHSFADNFPLRGMKSDVYEGGIRVPMAMSWKNKIKPGSVFETPVTTLDFLPTFLTAAGANLKNADYSKLEGKDLVKMINSTSGKDYDRSLFWYVNVDKGCMRKGDYKMVFLPKQQPQLYNIKNDIGETRDLFTTEKKVADAMTKEYMSWQKQLPPLKWYVIGKMDKEE